MALPATVQSIINYYVNLLIIQYHDKPKARATIAAFINALIANGIALDVRDGYNLETAVGVQLDVIGKYAGIDRFYKAQILDNYFAFTNYDEISIDPLKFGFSNYANYGTIVSNGWLTYDNIISSNFKLDDDSYRQLIKLKIIQNNSNHSHKSIDDSMFKFFGYSVVPSSSGDMHMYYFIPVTSSALIQAAADKQVLPRPMGVGAGYVIQEEPFFAFADYEKSSFTTDPGIEGYSTYLDYDTKEGEMLTYDKINRGF